MVIFLVDQNPIHSNLLKYNLTIRGFKHVQLYHSTDECIYRLRKNIIPDILISDTIHSSHDAFEFLKIIRKISLSIQVIFFTYQDDPDLAIRLIRCGATDYLLKEKCIEKSIDQLINTLLLVVRE